jgi:hypothetical protein
MKLLSEAPINYLTTESKSKSLYNWWSVSQYVKVSSPFCDLWPDITFCPKVVLWKLLSCLCGAPSLTRGRVCHMSFSVCSKLPVFASSIYVMSRSLYNRRSVSQSLCQGIEPILTCDQILLSVRRLFSEIWCLVFLRRPLWREVGSVICLSLSSNLPYLHQIFTLHVFYSSAIYIQ